METRPIVWVCREQGIRSNAGVGGVMDYTPAEAYGDLKFVTRTDIPLHPESMVRRSWMDDVNAFVEQYDPARDYVIATGRTDAICVIGYALGKAGKKPRFLVWRREDNHYRILDI